MLNYCAIKRAAQQAKAHELRCTFCHGGICMCTTPLCPPISSRQLLSLRQKLMSSSAPSAMLACGGVRSCLPPLIYTAAADLRRKLMRSGVYDPAVPPHISAAAAESVAFIGKAVLLLKNPAGAFRGAELLQYRDTLEFMQVRTETCLSSRRHDLKAHRRGRNRCGVHTG
eukprot:803044-Pelagomonas_calceolata.AAC.12